MVENNIFRNIGKRIGLILLCVMSAVTAAAQGRMYRCELGLQGGIGFYVGDAAEHIFTHPREAYGAQFRYRFNPRWSIQLKAQRQRISFQDKNYEAQSMRNFYQIYYNPMWSADAVAEFNFFRMGRNRYDLELHTFSPYMFLGIGTSVYNTKATLATADPYPRIAADKKFGFYFPIGMGVKWMFADQWQLQAAWQFQIYLADNVEGYVPAKGDKDENDNHLNNRNGLNGTNFLNNDLTSSLTVGVTWLFAMDREKCMLCGRNGKY